MTTPLQGMSGPTVPLHTLYAIPPGDSWVADPTASPLPTVPEKLVHCLWYEARWRPAVLRTLDGTAITVHTPGRWNVQSGPDFQHAVLTFGKGARRHGDVEIHRYASGWTAHRHHLDGRYNAVILHVFLWNDRQNLGVTRADGQYVPQVALEACLDRPVAAYHADIPLDDYPHKYVPHQGHCYEAIRRLPPQAVQAFLARAGEQRLQQRMWRWAYRSTEVGLGQVMYEAVLRSLGSTGHRQHFQELASVFSWQELQQCLRDFTATERVVAAESLLLGLTGIWSEERPAVASADADTHRYVTQLQHCWRRIPESVRQRAWRHVNWRQPGVRPANTPERRLAAMAHLLACHQDMTLLEKSAALCQAQGGTVASVRAAFKALTTLFDVPSTSYWARRAYLGSHPGRPQRLIGMQRALTVVVDAVLPVLLLQAQESQNSALRASVLACYGMAPRLPDNAVLRYMARRFLGDAPELLAQVRTAQQQQGLLQVFYDYCGNDEGDCQGCDFPLLSSPTASS